MSYINPPSDEILEVIKKHFAKEYGVRPQELDIDSIESYKKDGNIEYYLDFSINWNGPVLDTYEKYWGEITHNEVLQIMRDDKLKSILDDKN
jgi:hypothetical protein